MLEQIFLKVIDMSLSASIIIGIVILARILLKRFPKFISYMLWSVVLFRLLCPVIPKSEISLIPDLRPVFYAYRLEKGALPIDGELGETAVSSIGGAAEDRQTAGATVPGQTASGSMISGGIPGEETGSGEKTFGEMASEEIPSERIPSEETSPRQILPGQIPSGQVSPVQFPLGGKVKTAEVLWQERFILFGKYVWVSGISIMLLYCVISTIKIRNKVSISVPFKENIYMTDEAISPFVMGICNPKIYLPVGLGEKEREYIIMHEKFHIRRLDHIVKPVAFAALSIHWFNPLVWIAFILFSKDMEMSCDEAVIKRMGENIRADYSASLLALSTRRPILRGLPVDFGEGDTKDRIRNLAAFRKTKKGVVAVLVTGVVLLMICLISTREATVSEAQDIEAENTVTEQEVSAAADDAPVSAASRDTNIVLIYSQEGMEQAKPATLHQGDGYSFYKTDGDWMSLTVYFEDAVNNWYAKKNESVSFWIDSYAGLDQSQVERMLTKLGYTEENGYLWKLEEDTICKIICYEAGEDTWVLCARYPLEAEEGWGACIREMFHTFEVEDGYRVAEHAPKAVMPEGQKPWLHEATYVDTANRSGEIQGAEHTGYTGGYIYEDLLISNTTDKGFDFTVIRKDYETGESEVIIPLSTAHFNEDGISATCVREEGDITLDFSDINNNNVLPAVMFIKIWGVESLEGTLFFNGDVWEAYRERKDQLTLSLDITEHYHTHVGDPSNLYYIDENHILWGSGRNNCGQLGQGTQDYDFHIEKVKIAEHVIDVDYSQKGFIIYLTEDHRLYGVGNAGCGALQQYDLFDFVQYANSEHYYISEPCLLMENVTYARCGRDDVACLTEDGAVWIWGTVWNEGGWMKANAYFLQKPKKILENAVLVTGGWFNHAALLQDGTVWTWGYNSAGNCGVADLAVVSEPTLVAENVVMVWTDRALKNYPEPSAEEIAAAWTGKVDYNTAYDDIAGFVDIYPKLLDNTVIQKADGSYWVCGENVGQKEKVVYGMEGNYTVVCTHEFQLCE